MAGTTKATGARRAAAEKASAVAPEAKETAARLSALLRHVFRHDRGNMLRLIEESGLSMTQSKALFELGGLGEEPPRRVGELAERFGVSVAAMSRAVDGLVGKGLATRGEDPGDRRVRQVEITPKGRRLVEKLLVVRQEGIEAFAAGLTPAQRRKLDAAVESLMDRDDIASDYRLLREVTGR